MFVYLLIIGGHMADGDMHCFSESSHLHYGPTFYWSQKIIKCPNEGFRCKTQP